MVRYAFVLSLPERLLRSLGAVSGGLLRELGAVVLPSRVRRTALYRTMVEVTLRFLIRELGQVEGVYASEGQLAEGTLARDFLLQRGASHGIELLGLLTLHVSPVWILAALADATGAGHTLIRQISQALKEEGLLDKDAQFETADQLLDGLEKTSGHLADTLNLPPLNIAGLRREWTQFRNELGRLNPQNLPALPNLEKIWADLVHSARSERRTVFAVCSTLALSSLAELPANLSWLSRVARTATRRTGEVVGSALLTHYKEALQEISSVGFPAYWSRQFRPYLRAAAQQFAPARLSSTERLLRRRERS